jgi:hypothetical protein
MKTPELALDRDLLGDIKTRIRHPRPAERVRFQSAQGHMPCPHRRKPFTTCVANGNPTKNGWRANAASIPSQFVFIERAVR